jgi:hypothetical protein
MITCDKGYPETVAMLIASGASLAPLTKVSGDI